MRWRKCAGEKKGWIFCKICGKLEVRNRSFNIGSPSFCKFRCGNFILQKKSADWKRFFKSPIGFFYYIGKYKFKEIGK